MNIRKTLAALAMLACSGSMTDLCAMAPDSRPFVFTQPDGTKVTLRMKGGCTSSWTEDLAGFTVLRDGERIAYADLTAEGILVPTQWTAGVVDPASKGLVPGIQPLPPRKQDAALVTKPYTPWVRPQKGGKAGGITTNIAASGTVKNLVILAMFSDHNVVPAPENPVEGRPQADYDTLFNSLTSHPTLCPTGSVRTAYKTLSNEIVTMDSTVLAWVTLPQPMSYYAGSYTEGGVVKQRNGLPFRLPNNETGTSGYPNNAQKMLEDALALVDPSVNFGQFDQDNDGFIDAITIIHSGYAAEQGGSPAGSIWSHKANLSANWESADNNGNGVKVKVNDYHTEAALFGTTGTDITRIGVICHELGHFFGLPDLYDLDGTSWGLGAWCMMADSWGFSGNQRNPPHFSAWCRAFLGWTTPTLLTASGTYTAYSAEGTFPSIYKITHGFPTGEYLLIENRQNRYYDIDIPGSGLAIWHIDESVGDNKTEGFPGQFPDWPDNGKHFKIALVQADGLYDLEKAEKFDPGTPMNPSDDIPVKGDAGDLYRGGTGGVSEINMHTEPSTNSYKYGAYRPTTNRIFNISESSWTMTFQYEFEPTVFYVDKFSASPLQTGSYDDPFKTVLGAYNAATPGSLVLIRGASFTEPFPTMGKNLRIQTWRDNTHLQKP